MMYDYESELVEFWGKSFFLALYPDLVDPCILLRHVFPFLFPSPFPEYLSFFLSFSLPFVFFIPSSPLTDGQPWPAQFFPKGISIKDRDSCQTVA